MPFVIPDLAYRYADLSPVISEDIMRLHHSKHHQAYVDKLNMAVTGLDLGDDIEQILCNLSSLPESVRTTIRNNGGGHLNHSQFWQIMCPGGSSPAGTVVDALSNRYGSLDRFIEEFNTAALRVFGSGWAWLLPDLTIVTTPNQDNPIINGTPEPILGLDVWEHAYYLDYTYKRADYITAWWHVVNWQEVQNRYAN